MKPVEFTVTDCKADRYHYECSNLGDCGGTYYPAAEVDALRADLERCREMYRRDAK